MASEASRLPHQLIQYMEDHPHQQYGTGVIVATVVCGSLAIIAVALRFLSRSVGHVPIGLDDWFIVAGLACSLAVSLTFSAMVAWNYGYHIIYIAKPNFVKLGHAGYAAIVVLPVASWFVKISILMLYRRIFPLPAFKKFLWTCGIVYTAFFLAHFFATVFECLPVGAQFSQRPHTCVNLDNLFTATSFINAAFDVVILVSPLPIILTIQMTRQRKIQVALIFSVGIFTVAAGMLRSVFSYLDKDYDDTYYNARSSIWVIVEANVAVICACLPNLGPLYRRLRNGPLDQTRPYQYGSASNTKQSGSSTSTVSRSVVHMKNVKGSYEWAMHDEEEGHFDTASSTRHHITDSTAA